MGGKWQCGSNADKSEQVRREGLMVCRHLHSAFGVDLQTIYLLLLYASVCYYHDIISR